MAHCAYPVIATQTQMQSAAPLSLLSGYRALPSGYDEMLAEAGLPREQWQTLIGSLERLGPEEFAARGEMAQRLLREHGVSYNVYGDAQGTDRPWALDMV